MIYLYQALDNKGRSNSGHVEATSVQQAKQQLKAQGLYITEIREEKTRKTTNQESSGLWYKLNNLFQRVSARDRAIFTRQLGTLLKAGMELTSSLSDIAEQMENENFRKIVWSIKESIQEGASLSRAISVYPEVFNDLYIYMIRAGESLGRLDDILLRLAELEEKSNRIKSKIQSALVYPSFMVVMMVLVVSVLMTKVVPEITKVFSRSNAALPLPTKIVITISEILSDYWLLLFAALALTAYMVYRYLQSPEGRSKWDHFKLHNRVTKVLYGKILTARFARNLGVLLHSRVDLLDSLDITKKIVQNVHVEQAIEETAAEVKSGGSLARSLKSKEVLPKMVIGMISAGEASDQLDEMLLKISDIYEEDVETSIASFLSLLEPAIIVLMAVTVGFVVLSIIMPITQMNQLIQ
jgi:general secretion pathway protein F